MHHIDYGLGVLRRQLIASLPTSRPTDLATVYRQALARGDLAGYEVTQRFYEIGSQAGLEDLRQYLASKSTADEGVATA
jgi:N-acetyl-alpha-D-muramate 1-phosphate uridylyltransferase